MSNLTVVTAGDVTQKVLTKEPLFILDVRNESDYKDWKIEGENVESLNVPYFELIDGVDHIVDQLPTNKEILVVCAKEGSSEFVANLLVEAGFKQVSYFAGGMKAWSEHLYKAEVYKDDAIRVLQFIRVGKGCLSYMVISGEEAMVVDPARFIDSYEAVAAEYGAKITNIVDSHLHADHISGGKTLAEKTGAKYFLMKSEGAIFDFEALEENHTIDFEQVHVQVLAVKTPGHTPGSVSFFVNDKLLFSGDTIFVGGLGRPDLGGKAREWAADLYNSIYDQVATIADDVVVLPGHYADFDAEINNQGYIGELLGEIRSRNDVMQNKNKEEFVDIVAASANSETPPNFEEIVAINRGVMDADQDKQQELEIGPNRCAVHHTH